MNIIRAYNPKYNENGTIDLQVEFDHIPGIVPYTIAKDDISPNGKKLYECTMNGDFGEIAPFVKPPINLKMVCINISKNIQRHIEDVAINKGYDSSLSFCSYVTSSVKQYSTEAKAFVKWRDQVWNIVFPLLEKVESGELEINSTDIIGELPTFEG